MLPIKDNSDVLQKESVVSESSDSMMRTHFSNDHCPQKYLFLLHFITDRRLGELYYQHCNTLQYCNT